MSGWAGEASDVHSYVLEGPLSVAQQEDWTGQTPIETGIIYTIDSIDVSYFSGDVNGGTPAIVTSPVYDTGLDNPNYNTLAWNIAKNNYGGYETGDSPGANLILRVRANDSESALKASTDWSGAIVVDTKSASGSTTATGSIDNDRYVQFHAEFKSQPTAGKADYVKSCVLKNLSIKWLGETTSGGTTMVDANGYFTTRPDYGIFAIEVDGQLLTKGMRTTVEISESVLETTVACSSTVEVESRNTGK